MRSNEEIRMLVAWLTGSFLSDDWKTIRLTFLSGTSLSSHVSVQAMIQTSLKALTTWHLSCSKSIIFQREGTCTIMMKGGLGLKGSSSACCVLTYLLSSVRCPAGGQWTASGGQAVTDNSIHCIDSALYTHNTAIDMITDVVTDLLRHAAPYLDIFSRILGLWRGIPHTWLSLRILRFISPGRFL